MSTRHSSIVLASEGSFDTVSTDSLSEMRSLVSAYAEDPNGAVLDGWEPREGTIITEVRAISARINQNFDAWPSEELREAHHTFVGKPVFVNHNNHDPDRARGRVVASRYVDAGEHDRYVQVLQEVEASRFPMLAKELMEGGLDSVSMGAEAREVECSYCANISTSPFDACEHIAMKGSTLQRRTANGTPENVLIYEICRKISFFELSYVFDPADETAVASNVLVANREAVNDVEVPPKVDTLHPDDDEKSNDYWHEYVDDPNVIDTIDVLDEPDLGLNQQLERPEDELPEGFEEFENVDEEIEANEEAEAELAQESREKSQEKADEEAAAAQEQFEQEQAAGEADPEAAAEESKDPEDDENWEEEDDETGGTTAHFKGGGVEAMVTDDYGTWNMWVEKNGSLVASDSYADFREAKSAAVRAAKQHQAEWAGYSDFDDCKQQNSDKDDPDAYCGEIKNRADKESKMSDRKTRHMEAEYEKRAKRKQADADKDLYVKFLEYAKNQGIDLEHMENLLFDDPENPEYHRFEEAMYDFLQVDSVDDDDRLYTLLEAPGIYGISGHILGRKARQMTATHYGLNELLGLSTPHPQDPNVKVVTLTLSGGDTAYLPGTTKGAIGGQGEITYYIQPMGTNYEAQGDLHQVPLPAGYFASHNGSRRKQAENETGEACVDCLMIIANDDDSGMSDEQAEASRAGIADWQAEGYTVVADDFEDPSFGSYPCEVCGTRLAGDRVPVTFMKISSASCNGSPRAPHTNDREASRKESHMAPQRRRRTADDNNKQTPLLEETGIAQTPAPEPVALPEEGDSVPNNSESDRVKAAREALKRELARERAFQAQQRRARAVGEQRSNPGGGENIKREDLFEEYPATTMTARLRKRFANWVEDSYGSSLREASGPGELRSWARAFSKEAGIDLPAIHSAIKRDVEALRTAEDKEDVDKKDSLPPEFVEKAKETKEENEDEGKEKDAARAAARRRRAAQQAQARRQGRTQTPRRRTADEKLDVAAPGDRVNVEKPTSGTTDEDAEASQFDKSDFDNNSGKGLENVDNTATPGIPGGPSVNDLKKSNRATGLQAVALAEAMIAANLIENTREAKFKAAAQFEKMSRDVVLDRTALLEKVVTANKRRPSSATKSAGNRGASLNSAVPPNMSGAARSSAPQTREASSDTDSDLFF